VAILPYLEQGNLGHLYDHNKRWNDPANEDLKERMPVTYMCPSAPDSGTPAPTTGFQTSDYVYPRAATDWENGQALLEDSRYMKFRDATDGLSNTLMVYESASRANWYVHGKRMSVAHTYDWGAPFVYNWGDLIEAWSSHYPGGWFFPVNIELDSANPTGVYPTVSWSVGPVINVSNWYAAPYSFHHGGVQVCMGDGSVRFISESTSLDAISAATSCNGGEVLGEF